MKKLLNAPRDMLLGMAFLLLATHAALAADVDFFGITKTQMFVQENSTAPVLVDFEDLEEGDDPPFLFYTFVDLTGSNAVTSATLTLPSGAVQILSLGNEGFSRQFSDGAEFKPNLDLVYSNATYTLFLQTQNDGDKTIPMTFPSGDDYPNPPRISNFTAAQGINTAADFTVTWDDFTDGTAADFIQFEIVNPDTDTTVFQTEGPGAPGSLNGTSTSVLIPGGTLSEGRSYLGRIFFAKIVDLDDTTYGDDVAGVAAFLVETGFEVHTTGGMDTTPPDLQSHVPFNMQMDVESRAVVAFTFNEAMDTDLSLGASISWSGNVNGGLVTHTWSADGRTLFCVYPPGFPTNAFISWQLNPGGSPQNIRDAAGNPLASQSGSFNTGSETGAGQTDVGFLALVKGHVFRQTGDSPAEALELNQFAMTSDLNILNGVTNGLVTLPNARTVTPELDFGDSFDFEAIYSSQAQVDSFFPDGAYQVRLDTVHDGTRTFNFTLSGSLYPNAPQILDFPATQTVDPTNDFVVSWDAFVGGTAGDYISLEIEAADDSMQSGVFETPGLGKPGALNGTNTSVTIPAFTFAPGRAYNCELLFVKAGQVDTSTYPGAVAASGYFSITFFELRTLGEAIRPALRISANSTTSALITITGEKNRFYTVESADGLAGDPIQWMSRVSDSASTNISGFTGSFHFDDGAPAPGGVRFYRAREGSDFGGGQ